MTKSVSDWSYTLDHTERAVCHAVAEDRYMDNRRRGNSVGKCDRRDHIVNGEVEGVAGELAFAAITNLFLDMKTTHPAHPVFDFRAPNGLTIDVKAALTDNKRRVRLLVPKEKIKKPCDWYALMLLDWPDKGLCPTATFVGACHKIGVFSPDHFDPFMPVPCFAVDQRGLVPPGDFLPMLRG